MNGYQGFWLGSKRDPVCKRTICKVRPIHERFTYFLFTKETGAELNPINVLYTILTNKNT
jgi:hypothetical protein